MQAFGCPKRVSAIAILDHGGAEDQHARLLALAEQGRAAWQALHADLVSSCGRPPHAQPLLGGPLPQVWSFEGVGCAVRLGLLDSGQL